MKKNIIHTAILLSVFATVILFCLSSPSELQLEEGSGVNMEGDWFLDGYVIKDIEPSKVEKKQLPEDTTFLKKQIYSVESQSRQLLSATIVLSGADPRSIHRPEVCLPGQGWQIENRKLVKVELEGGELPVMELRLKREDTMKGGGEHTTYAIYVYWLVGKDVVTAHTWERILISNWDNLFHSKAHRWAYPSFMVAYTVNGAQSEHKKEKQAVNYVYEVIKKIAPQFMKVELD